MLKSCVHVHQLWMLEYVEVMCPVRSKQVSSNMGAMENAPDNSFKGSWQLQCCWAGCQVSSTSLPREGVFAKLPFRGVSLKVRRPE